MIIQIRGTSGSGKTTVMRQLMAKYGPWKAVTGSESGLADYEKRKKPLYYESRENNLVVLGHYESTCGGCDNIGSARAVAELIHSGEFSWYPRILCEGLLLSEDVKWSKEMDDLVAVFLTTPLDRCLRQVAQRRQEAGNDEPLNPKNTENRVAVIERARQRLLAEAAQVKCIQCPSEKAASLITKLLGL